MKGLMEMKRTMCRRCGNWFVTKGDNVMCPYCISTVLAEVTEQRPKKKKKDIPQIIKDANDAAEHGMSYGEWMASRERRQGI